MLDNSWDQRESRSIVKQPTMQYIIATIAVFTIGMIAVVLVSTFRVADDNGILITAIIGFTGTTLASVLAFMKSQETHVAVNSRMDDFIKKFEISSLAKQDLARNEGRITGRTEGRDIADARTDLLSGHSSKVAVVTDPLIEIEKNTKDAAETLKEIKDR